jgi:hypothetical protein
LLKGEDGSRSLSAVVCAAWALSLRCYTGLTDICFGFEEVGTASRAEAALLRIDENMILEEIMNQCQGNECFAQDSNAQLDFNTSVLVRLGTAVNGAKQPAGASVMPEKVSSALHSVDVPP